MAGSVQAGGYALELAACSNGTRLFCYGIVLDDDRVTFWYYDASGYVKTEETISIIANFERFAAIMIAFASCGARQWGALPPVIQPPSSSPAETSFPFSTLCQIQYGEK